MAPRRRCAVVRGTTQKDWTPFSRSMAISFGKRRSCMMSFTINGCWVFHTNPPGDSSTGSLQTRADRAGLRSHQEPQAHDVARGLMQDHVDVIERDDVREPLGEITKAALPGRGVMRWIRILPAGDVADPDRESGLDDGGHCPQPRQLVCRPAGEIPRPFHHRRPLCTLANPMAPSRRSAVVRGTMQKE